MNRSDRILAALLVGGALAFLAVLLWMCHQ